MVHGLWHLQLEIRPAAHLSPNDERRSRHRSFEGLVRPHRNGEPVTPGEFFSLVAPEDIENIDSILRTIHILNTGRLNRSRARVFVNFHPGLFQTPAKMRQEVERMRLTAHEAGMTADRIVCEISEKKSPIRRWSPTSPIICMTSVFAWRWTIMARAIPTLTG